MKRFLLLLAITIFSYNSYGQSFKKYLIGDSGCSAYFFCDPGTFDLSYSDDSSKVYTGECKTTDTLTYGIICIKLKEAVEPGKDAEELMTSYLDYLKTAFGITSSAGYGKGHTLKGKEDARGIIDYWEDKEGDSWKIKSWSDGKLITVMYVYAKGQLDETTKVNIFLDSFRFPGM